MNRTVLIFILGLSGIAWADNGYKYRPESNPPLYGAELNPVLYVNNDRPPIIRLKPGVLIWMEFEREVEKCSDAANIFRTKKYYPEQTATKSGPVKLMELYADAKNLASVSKSLQGKRNAAGKSLSVWDLPATNINCRYADGDVIVLMVKISRKPHAAVLLKDVPRSARDYSDFSAVSGSGKPVIRRTPFFPEPRKPAPVLVRHKMKTDPKKLSDRQIFVSALGSGE